LHVFKIFETGEMILMSLNKQKHDFCKEQNANWHFDSYGAYVCLEAKESTSKVLQHEKLT
jgi:hypothetical protein